MPAVLMPSAAVIYITMSIMLIMIVMIIIVAVDISVCSAAMCTKAGTTNFFVPRAALFCTAKHSWL